MIQQLTAQIRQYDRQIQQLCQQKYPDTETIQQIRGVGPITALAFVLTLEDARRLEEVVRWEHIWGSLPDKTNPGIGIPS